MTARAASSISGALPPDINPQKTVVASAIFASAWSKGPRIEMIPISTYSHLPVDWSIFWTMTFEAS